MNQPRYSLQEERWNAVTHIFGVLAAIPVAIWLVVLATRHHSLWAYVGIFLYIFGLLASYITSSLYHATLPENPKKQILRKWDHAAIYWHIAGSYSPLMLLPMRQEGLWGWALFIFVWTCALVGTGLTFRHLKEKNHLETICYVAMGLSILVAFKPLANTVSYQKIACIIAEGVCYILGAVIYALFKRTFTHTLFHFCVLAGSACHIAAVVLVFQ